MNNIRTPLRAPDTILSMESVIRLYITLGFRDIPPCRFHPVNGSTYLELRLI